MAQVSHNVTLESMRLGKLKDELSATLAQLDRETAAETAQVRSSACSAHARTRTRPHAHARTHTPARHCWT
jgi:predicted phage gp36 major capsid-like protein